MTDKDINWKKLRKEAGELMESLLIINNLLDDKNLVHVSPPVEAWLREFKATLETLKKLVDDLKTEHSLAEYHLLYETLDKLIKLAENIGTEVGNVELLTLAEKTKELLKNDIEPILGLSKLAVFIESASFPEIREKGEALLKEAEEDRNTAKAFQALICFKLLDLEGLSLMARALEVINAIEKGEPIPESAEQKLQRLRGEELIQFIIDETGVERHTAILYIKAVLGEDRLK